MRNKKAKKLRKQLGMTTENLRQKDYVAVKTVKKIMWVKNKFENSVPIESLRTTLVNRNLNFYRKSKKLLKGQ